ncbi:MAG: DEAD/DEAH box helicase [Gammaproteobacteria bacterium]|nr:DEAD/DEAH box helicase [Gammaproteobacteria bacterium]
MSFDNLGLKPELLRAVEERGYTVPTPVQLRAIPEVLARRDLLAGAQTGTGKTAGFVLPILQLLTADGVVRSRTPRVLVLVPTRELAAQVAESAMTYGKYVPVSVTVVFGGVGFHPQAESLRRGTDIVVATPGRLLDHVQQRTIDLGKVEILVLDEADRMLDMGFIRDIRRIIKLLPAKRQNLMFSATYTPDIRTLAARILVNPVQVEVTPPNSTVERVTQLAFRVAKDDKRHLLVHLFENGANGEGRWHQALVFTRTKHGANRLAEQLGRAGIRSAAIHGNKSQAARTRALADFKAGKLTALVATEVASRGLDIRELPQVVNYDMPHVPEDYVHRIGRTARAGNDGHAVSLVCADEASLLRDIERTMRQAVPFSPTPAFARVEHAPAPQAARTTPSTHRAPGGPSRPHRSRAAPRSYGGRRSGGR